MSERQTPSMVEYEEAKREVLLAVALLAGWGSEKLEPIILQHCQAIRDNPRDIDGRRQRLRDSLGERSK